MRTSLGFARQSALVKSKNLKNVECDMILAKRDCAVTKEQVTRGRLLREAELSVRDTCTKFLWSQGLTGIMTKSFHEHKISCGNENVIGGVVRE